MALAGVLAACAGVAPPPDAPGLPRPVPIYVIDRDWHTEIGLSAEDLAGPLAGLRLSFPGARTLLFGFGDRRYLEQPHPGFGDALLAALSGPGALLVTGLPGPPAAGTNLVTLGLTDAGARRAFAYVWASFAHDAAGGPVALGPGPYPGSTLYAASATYTLSHTCNTWTAEVLAQGGAAVSPDGVVTAGEAMARARAALR